MTRTRNSAKARRICFEAHRHDGPLGPKRYLTCHVCKCEIDTVCNKSGWHADHIRRWADDGEDTDENVWPICPECHAPKSANDTTEIAKGKRQGANHYGLREKRGAVMPGSKRSKWRKRMDGTVERR